MELSFLTGLWHEEASGVVSFENRRKFSYHPGSVGPLAPSVEAQIVDSDAMKCLSPLQKGEIWIKGPLVMRGMSEF